MEKAARTWKANIRKVVPYVPGDQPKGRNLIKLNTNENPYPPAPGVEQLLHSMDCGSFRKYPDPASSLLVKTLAKYYGVEQDQVFVGVGSDDVLAIAFMTFFNSERPILFPDVTYSFYEVWADLFRIPYRTIPVGEDFRMNCQDYSCPNGGIVFPNPNAPTGLCLALEQVEAMLESNRDVVVIVDEAYIDFGGESSLKLVEKYDNLVVVQTFSKSRSMAGLRIGFAIGNPELIRAMNDIKYSYNSYTMNVLSIVLGTEAVKDEIYFKSTIKQIIETREQAKAKLSELGFSFPDSQTNFIFARHESCPAKVLFEALRSERIYVRYFDKPRLDNYLRITIGTKQEMEALYRFLETYLY